MEEESKRENRILERILTLKQMVADGRGGPLELHELGICYYHLENYPQSIDYLNRLVQEYSGYLEIAAVHSLRVYIMIQLGSYTDAEEIIHERLAIYTQDTTLLALLAHIYEKRQDFHKAIDTHRKVLDIDDGNINSLNSLGYLLTLHGSDSEEREAYNCLKKVIQKKPDHPAYLDSFGVFLARKGRTDDARRALMKALNRAPTNTEIMQHIKEVLKL